MNIGRHAIGTGNPMYVIAELSANHNQDYEKAVELIHAAAKAGADAIKLQTYTPDTITIDCNNEYFRVQKGTLWEGKTLYELYAEAFTPWEWQPKLKKVANDLGMDCFSTPFDETAVDFLEDMDVPAYKIASFELTDIPLIQNVAATGKPIIMSTGMGSKEEIVDAVQVIRDTGNEQIILLKCTSAYPALPKDANLNTIPDMRECFSVDVGISDHTLGNDVVLGALSLGACIVEKHFCMSRNEPGPDSAFSLEPEEFREMVNAIRKAEKDPKTLTIQENVLGSVRYAPSQNEKPSTIFRKSIFATQDIKEGEELTKDNIRVIRPSNGLSPKEFPKVLKKKAKTAIKRGTPLIWGLIQADE